MRKMDEFDLMFGFVKKVMVFVCGVILLVLIGGAFLIFKYLS